MTSAIRLDFHPVSAFPPSIIKKFDSGNTMMNSYFHRYAKKNHKNHMSPCIVMCPEGNKEEIYGYITLSNATIEKGDPPFPPLSKFPNYPLPVTLIGRLAISTNHQKKGLGTHLMMHAFFTAARSVRELNIGSIGMITDAIDKNAEKFYERFDFKTIPLQDQYPKRMFIDNYTIFDAIDS